MTCFLRLLSPRQARENTAHTQIKPLIIVLIIYAKQMPNLFTMETDEVDERIMAASPGAEEDSVFDTGRLSLFDLIIERTRAQNKVGD